MSLQLVGSMFLLTALTYVVLGAGFALGRAIHKRIVDR